MSLVKYLAKLAAEGQLEAKASQQIEHLLKEHERLSAMPGSKASDLYPAISNYESSLDSLGNERKEQIGKMVYEHLYPWAKKRG